MRKLLIVGLVASLILPVFSFEQPQTALPKLSPEQQASIQKKADEIIGQFLNSLNEVTTVLETVVDKAGADVVAVKIEEFNKNSVEFEKELQDIAPYVNLNDTDNEKLKNLLLKLQQEVVRIKSAGCFGSETLKIAIQEPGEELTDTQKNNIEQGVGGIPAEVIQIVDERIKILSETVAIFQSVKDNAGAKLAVDKLKENHNKMKDLDARTLSIDEKVVRAAVALKQHEFFSLQMKLYAEVNRLEEANFYDCDEFRNAL